MSMTKTVLIVSPHFPPSTLAGVHRARHLAKHLPGHGWRPIVVRVDERYYTESGDPDLAMLVPTSVEQVRTGAVPARIGRLAGVGDIGLRGFFPIRRALAALASRTEPDALLITGSPFYPMLLSGWARRRLNIPVVLDFQDPWVSVEGASRPPWSKGGLAHRLAVALEPCAVRHADYITSVSERQNDEMAARYPWLDPAHMAAIPIGGDPDDYAALRARPPARPAVRLDPALINLSYVGTFLPRAGPLVHTVFRALAGLRRSHPQLASRIRFNFVGTSNQRNGHGQYRVLPIGEEEGVGDLVVEIPERVSFLDALSILANSQGLLLIGSDEPHYTASKIYPTLMSGRPYVSLFHRASSAHEILSKAGGGFALAFADRAELDFLGSALAVALFRLATKVRLFPAPDRSVYSKFSADEIARRFADILDRATRYETS